MPVVETRYNAKHDKVVHDGCYFPTHSVIALTSKPSVFTVPIQPAASPNAFQNRNTIIFDLETAEVECVERAYFKFQLSTIASTLELAPVFEWFEDILIEESKGVGEELARIYPMTQWMYFWSCMCEEQRESCARNGAFKLVQNSKGEVEIQRDRVRGRLVAGQPKEFYLPIPVNFMNNGSIDMRHIINDLRIRLRVASSNNVVVSGNSSDLRVDDIELIVDSVEQLPFDEEHSMKHMRTKDHGFVFLDTEVLTYNDKTLNANAKLRHDLDAFVGKAAFIAMVIKNSTNPTGEDRYRYADPTDSARIDLESSAGVSLYGEGTPVDIRHIKHCLTHKMAKRYIKGITVLDFSDVGIKQAFEGTVGGYHQFVGNKIYFSVEFPSPPVAEVQELFVDTVSGVADGGGVGFEVDGESSIQASASNSPSDYATFINGTEKMLDKGYTVSVNQNFAAGNSIQLTFSPAGEIDLNTVVKVNSNLTSAGTSKYYTGTTKVTEGQDGWTSGSNYQTELYLFKFRELKITSDGKLLVRDM